MSIADPDSLNPSGYVRFYNSVGQPLTVAGKPDSTVATHIPLDYVGKIEGWGGAKMTNDTHRRGKLHASLNIDYIDMGGDDDDEE